MAGDQCDKWPLGEQSIDSWKTGSRGWGKRKLQARYITAPPPYFWVIFLPISLVPSLRYRLFSGSASCDWSLTKTLSAPWIHISSVFLLISIKRSSHNDTPNGPTSQSRPGGESLLDYWKKQTYYRRAKGCCLALIGVVWRCLRIWLAFHQRES